MEKYGKLEINWLDTPSREIYEEIIDYHYGEVCNDKDLTDEERKKNVLEMLTPCLYRKRYGTLCSLISVGRFPVRCVVKWSCYVTTKKCPIIHCNQDETIEHLLLECNRSVENWEKVKEIGLKFKRTKKAIIYGVLQDVPAHLRVLYWEVIHIVNSKIWKTRAKMVIHQCMYTYLLNML